VISAGSSTISVEKVADANYPASSKATLLLTVAQRPVRIETVAVSNKVYDGSLTATLASTPTLVGLLESDASSVWVNSSAVSASFSDANASPDKLVTLSGSFALAGDAAKLLSYTLASAPTTGSASITPAVPVWNSGSGALQASALHFGQRLSASELGGEALGIGTDGVVGHTGATVLAGTLTWDDDVDLSAMLDPGNYNFDVVFSPADSNYATLADTVSLSVLPATPEMSGRVDDVTPGAPPTGSAIFTNTAPETNSLADSKIAGDVVYYHDGIATAVFGSWSWDTDDAATADAYTTGYVNKGLYHPQALFTPTDTRIAPATFSANVAVYSPRTVITKVPELDSVVYGSRLSSATIGDDGVAKAIEFSDTAEAEWEDISAKGSWSWKTPDSLITSLEGHQSAVLVFTPEPEYAVDWDNPEDGYYVEAELEVELVVDKALPATLSLGSAPDIHFGEALSASDLALSGYSFAGVSSMGHSQLEGSFNWDDASIIPGAPGYENSTDELANSYSAKDDGIYVATANFSASAPYDAVYEDLSLPVLVNVRASTQTANDLAQQTAEALSLAPVFVLAAENYRAGDVATYTAALEDAQAAVVSGNRPEGESAFLLAELQSALSLLTHDHPLLTHSAPEPISVKGVGVSVSFKGHFGSVSKVVINGLEAQMLPTLPDRYELWLGSANAVFAGTLTRGSAVVTLASEYVDSLANADYSLEVYFSDDFAEGKASTGFSVKRPIETPPLDPGPGPGPLAPDPGPDPVPGSGSVVAPSGSAVASVVRQLTDNTDSAVVDNRPNTDSSALSSDAAADALSADKAADGSDQDGNERLSTAVGADDNTALLVVAALLLAALAAAGISIVVVRRKKDEGGQGL
jgi:hypothetical protein